MDPLSISASIAGLLSLAGATVTTLDDLFNNVLRSRPAVLLAVSEEISALCLVLGELEGRLLDSSPRNPKDDKKGLLAVLDGCMRTFQLLSAQLGELQSKFQRGSLRKALGFLLYPGRMKEIAALREDLEKYKATLLIALQVHKPMESMSVESLRQDIENLRSKILEMSRRDTIVDLERMDVIKDYLATSSTMLSAQDPSAVVEDPSGSANAGGHQAARDKVSDSVIREGQVGQSTSSPRNETASRPANSDSDVPTFHSFDDWLSTFVPDSEAGNADELLSEFRNRRKNNSVNSAAVTVPPATIDTIEVENPTEMIPGPEALSLISQQLVMRNDLPEGQIHVIFVNLRKCGSDQTFTEDLITSSDTPIYKLIHELHCKGYTTICGFESMDRQSTYSPIVSHDSLLPVVVTGDSSQYNIPSGLQINVDERLIDFFNRFILDDTAIPAKDILSLKRCGDGIRIYDGRVYSMNLKFQRTLRIPEDGKSYPLPAFFGTYPLLSVEAFSDRLPPLMRKKGGLFIPMFQREALSVGFDPVYFRPSESFAIRVYAGSVNAITGKTAQSHINDGGQDYVVVPKQRRLDGFFAGKGEVKQFVAMPLGFGYSVEKQVTGTEFIGGIQLEIIPRLSDKVKFIRFPYDFAKSPWLPQQLETSEDIFKTPRQLGIVAGQRLLMQDMMKQSKRIKFDLGFLDDIDLGNTRRQYLFPVHDEKCRPTFVHEMFCGTGRHKYSMKKSLVLYPVKPFSVRVDWQAVMRSPKGTTVEEYSPFLDISDFKRLISSIKRDLEELSPRAGYLLFNGTAHKGYPAEYSPLSEYALDGGIVSFEEDPSAGTRGHDYRAGMSVGATQKPPSWEMTLGAGGTLGQSIQKTEDERLWNWGASKFINIQILNSVAFKQFTSISPVTPISFREYVKARIPFYSFLPLGEDAVISDGAPTFKSISQFDRRATAVGIHIDASKKLVGCANCEENLCDSILQPCKHAFCSKCIKFEMTKHSEITCAFCFKAVTKTVVFSAPMEMPLVARKETDALEPVIQNPAEDAMRESSSSVIAQRREDNESSSELVKNLMVVLLELAKDEMSPNCTPDEEISHLVVDTITGGHAVSFNMAIRHLTQATIDIRIPILKAALPKALRYKSFHHVQQLLLLVPNIDDMDDHNIDFIRTAMELAHGGDVFVIMFQWITGGSRSIEDFGLSVKELFVLACSDPALDLLVQFIADRKQTLAECGISVMTVGKPELSKVAKLIQHGCDPNERNAAGQTLLHLTGDSGSETEKLLSLGARVDAADNDGNTGIHLSVPPNSRGHVFHETRLAVLLRDKMCTPAVVNMRNRDGLTAYHLSLTRPAYIRKRLLTAGADPKLDIPNGKFRDEVVGMLRGKDWRKEGYALDDRLVQELQSERV